MGFIQVDRVKDKSPCQHFQNQLQVNHIVFIYGFSLFALKFDIFNILPDISLPPGNIGGVHVGPLGKIGSIVCQGIVYLAISDPVRV